MKDGKSLSPAASSKLKIHFRKYAGSRGSSPDSGDGAYSTPWIHYSQILHDETKREEREGRKIDGEERERTERDPTKFEGN